MSVNSQLDFEKFVHEANKYFKDLAEMMGHPEEVNRSFIAWRAVMHTLRDRIHTGEAMDMMSQMPMILKGFFAENWQYHEQPQDKFDTMDEMTSHVEKMQEQYGEVNFNWDMSTEEIISTVIDSMKKYLTDGQIDHMKSQLPEELEAAMN
jgi:uncharacterized protein (DUF2267 family)